jgi:hypothetical protein
MPISLLSSIDALTLSFANSVLAAIRGASLDELLGEGGDRHRGPARASTVAKAAATRIRESSTARLARRSAGDIAHALDKVVALVKRNRDGLRAEQIRQSLGMQAKEMPRVLKQGLASRKLRAKGHKRATTYTAA